MGSTKILVLSAVFFAAVFCSAIGSDENSSTNQNYSERQNNIRLILEKTNAGISVRLNGKLMCGNDEQPCDAQIVSKYLQDFLPGTRESDENTREHNQDLSSDIADLDRLLGTFY